MVGSGTCEPSGGAMIIAQESRDAFQCQNRDVALTRGVLKPKLKVVGARGGASSLTARGDGVVKK